jgi:hypothetical protein
MTMAETMDRLGLDATVEQYGQAFKSSQYDLWHANAGARRLLNQDIQAPWSGDPKHNIHANDIDFQIEADFIGLMAPGLPREANKYCERVGRVMNYGDGLYGGEYSDSGGRADIYLDGNKDSRGLDAYADTKTHDNDLWHVYGLTDGEHKVRIVSRQDSHPRSRGHKLVVSEAVVYKPSR